MLSGPVKVSSLGRAALHYHPLQDDSAAPMAPLPPIVQPDPTLEAADAAMIAAERAQPRRTYLGMSALGDECSRRLWYNFHDPLPQDFDAATLKRFADGHASEDVLVNRIRAVHGVSLMAVDPTTGRQWALEDFGGRLRGHMDGVVIGLLQAPKTWHVFEAKSANEKSFAKLTKLKAEKGEKDALRAWNPTYWAQAILYLGYSEMTRHWLVCCTPGARDWISVRTEFDPAEFASLKDKARRILDARAPLAKLSNDGSWFACKWCHYHARCHGGA